MAMHMCRLSSSAKGTCWSLLCALQVRGRKSGRSREYRQSNGNQTGLEAMKKGDCGSGRQRYTRSSFARGGGWNSDDRTVNEMLGLPEEDIDEATALAIEKQKEVVA